MVFTFGTSNINVKSISQNTAIGLTLPNVSNKYSSHVGLTATTASPMAGYGRGHSFFLKMAMVAEF